MLSTVDLERLIAEKRLEIEKEKKSLGLSSPESSHKSEDVYRSQVEEKPPKRVNFAGDRELCENNASNAAEKKEKPIRTTNELEEDIPPDLERYIRRYLGLPVMLKAGEYSPNNPLVRGERAAGDVLLGLGEYERRRNTLRRLRQQQYREYLDQQAKKKQEAKEQAERERREREEKEREREEREREREEWEREREEREKREREREERERRLAEQDRRSPGRSRAGVSYANAYGFTNKVDTGVQVDSITAPLSVAVQTDEADFFRLPSPCKSQLTQAERELSPHMAAEDRPIQPAAWATQLAASRRRSYGDFDEHSSTLVKRPTRDKLTSELRHSYMPSIFDADAIQLRNLQAEKEAAARRQFYQQELKNQIMEQQRIREERKTREKMLEQAEMRRLEEQLRMLRVAQEREVGRQRELDCTMKEETTEYDKKRTELQKEIDEEQKKLIRAPLLAQPHKRTATSKSDTDKPFYYPKLDRKENTEKKPYSTNIPDHSIFSPTYDVDSYLRRNLNFKDNRFEFNNNIDIESIGSYDNRKDKIQAQDSVDSLPIPVLRHSPVLQTDKVESPSNLSDAMKKIDDKWKVPVVQKNILKSIPNDEGKNVSILTQLGSIRRQLQLEQLKLDKISKGDV